MIHRALGFAIAISCKGRDNKVNIKVQLMLQGDEIQWVDRL